MTNKSLRTSGARNSPAQSVGPVRDINEAQLLGMPDSAYMNDTQLAFFRHRLLRMRHEGLTRETSARQLLNQSEAHAAHPDRATTEEKISVERHQCEREAQLLEKIDEALARIRSGHYGYCTQTSEPIGIARLLAHPTATLCIDRKEQQQQEA